MQLWAPGATYEQKGGSPKKMFRTPKNRQARNHPILLLGSLGTQKTGSGLSVFQNVYKGDPWGPQTCLYPDFQKYRFPGVPRGSPEFSKL